MFFALARVVPPRPPLTRSGGCSPQYTTLLNTQDVSSKQFQLLFSDARQCGVITVEARPATGASPLSLSLQSHQYHMCSFALSSGITLFFLVVLVAVFCIFCTILAALLCRVWFPVLVGEIGRRLRSRRQHGHRAGHHQRQEHPEKAVLSHRHRVDSPCGHRHRRLRHDEQVGCVMPHVRVASRREWCVVVAAKCSSCLTAVLRLCFLLRAGLDRGGVKATKYAMCRPRSWRVCHTLWGALCHRAITSFFLTLPALRKPFLIEGSPS